tara:strand:- start:452 stop:646 length:195 start_codon:yes stop_codon:yes gene_type:complete
MILCELGQIRKEATAAGDSCAEVWLGRLPPNSSISMTYTIKIVTDIIGATMKSAIIPYLSLPIL